jgi:hypothetical protein
VKILGLGGLLGLLVGIAVAEWLGNQNDAAYYSVVIFIALLGTAIGKFLFGKSDE